MWPAFPFFNSDSMHNLDTVSSGSTLRVVTSQTILSSVPIGNLFFPSVFFLIWYIQIILCLQSSVVYLLCFLLLYVVPIWRPPLVRISDSLPIADALYVALVAASTAGVRIWKILVSSGVGSYCWSRHGWSRGRHIHGKLWGHLRSIEEVFCLNVVF